MTRFRLRTQLFIATLLTICGLTGALLFIIRHTVSVETQRQVREGKITVRLESQKVSGKHDKKKQRQEAEAPALEIDLANVEKANLVPEI